MLQEVPDFPVGEDVSILDSFLFPVRRLSGGKGPPGGGTGRGAERSFDTSRKAVDILSGGRMLWDGPFCQVVKPRHAARPAPVTLEEFLLLPLRKINGMEILRHLWVFWLMLASRLLFSR